MISRNFTITTTRQQIITPEPLTRTVWLHVIGVGVVYVGGDNVTTTNGLLTEKSTVPQQLTIPAGESLYAVVASSTEDLRILLQGD